MILNNVQNFLDMDISKIAQDVRQDSEGPRKLVLMSNQKKHFNYIIKKILPYSEGYIDGSDMGRGKTITACAISIYYKLPLFVICPYTIIKVWKDAIDAFGLKCIDVISYQTFTGMKHPTHDYLIKEEGDYYPTETLLDIISKGALFIFDECQFIKNYSTERFKACNCVTRHLKDTVSRFGILSATLFDKINFSVSIMRFFNIIKGQKLYTKRKDTGQVYLHGLEEVIKFSDRLDSKQTKEIVSSSIGSLSYENINRKTSEELIFQLYDKIIKNKIGSSIEGHNLNFKINLHDGFFIVDPEVEPTLRKHIAQFEDAALPLLEEGGPKLHYLTRLNKLRVMIETDKLGIFARLAREKLSQEGTRVAIALNSVSNIKRLEILLEEFKPLVLIGEVRNRGEIIDKFQEKNSNRRLLILNVRLGQGISLHDLHGTGNTYVYISSSYSIIDMTQNIGRFYREGVKSDTSVYIVYTNTQDCCEHRIMTALINKLRVTKGSVPGYKKESRLPLPGEFEKYYER